MGKTKRETMDAKRLEKVARFLFPDTSRSWKTQVAEALDIHVTTVRRWVLKNDVPAGYDKLIECLACRKQDLWGKIDEEIKTNE